MCRHVAGATWRFSPTRASGFYKFFSRLRSALAPIHSGNARYPEGLVDLPRPFAGDPTLPTACYRDSPVEPSLLPGSNRQISQDVSDGSLSSREAAADSSRAGGAQTISLDNEIAVEFGPRSGCIERGQSKRKPEVAIANRLLRLRLNHEDSSSGGNFPRPPNCEWLRRESQARTNHCDRRTTSSEKQLESLPPAPTRVAGTNQPRHLRR